MLTMNMQLYNFFTNDHRRLEAILDKATLNLDEIDMELYHQFRVGLLTHIKMEEKVFFPAALQANNGEAIPLMAKLRLEHGAITALMVPPPTAELVKVLCFILDAHDKVEEENGGVYDVCERLTKQQTNELLQQLQNTTTVPIQIHNTAAYALDAAKRALLRAGYDYDVIIDSDK